MIIDALIMPPTLKKLEGHIAFGLSVCASVNSWPPKPLKYFSVGIFEYILASMPNVYLNV